MRNTEDAGKTLETIWLSSRALLQVVAKRLFDHYPAPPAGMLLASPCVRSWSMTVWNNPGGMDR